MSRARSIAVVATILIAGLALIAWAMREARVQRREVEAALHAEASVLSRSLVPALAAASMAARELDDVVAWKLLDNARLLGRLDAGGALDDATLTALRESNGLDSVVMLDGAARVRRVSGESLPDDLLDDAVRAVAGGKVQEAVLGWTSDEGPGHVAAAAARTGGGAVVVRTDAGTAYAFARRVGVPNLLDNTVGTGRVLYLAFEETGRAAVEASWDGGIVPPAVAGPGSTRSVRGRPVLEVRYPVPMAAGREAALRVGLDARPIERATLAATRRTVLVGAVLGAVGLMAAALAFVGRARALERAESARRLAELERSQQRAERLAAAGALSAGVAHEIRNPLNAIGLAAQRIERRHPGGDCNEFAVRIRDEVARLERILAGFLTLARPASGAREPVDLVRLVDEVRELLETEGGERGVRIETTGATAGARVSADREALRGAVVNLVRNAIAASPEGGTVALSVDADGSRARIVVRDSGPGPDDEFGESLFEPFVTTRAEGTGLGLTLVRRVAEEHGGRARLRALDGGGAEAVLEIDAAGGG